MNELEKKLDALNQELLDGILEDLRAPGLLQETGDEVSDKEAMAEARARARMARVSAEAALRRHNVTGVMEGDKARTLASQLAGKMDFSAMPKRPALPAAGAAIPLRELKLSAAPPASVQAKPSDGDAL